MVLQRGPRCSRAEVAQFLVSVINQCVPVRLMSMRRYTAIDVCAFHWPHCQMLSVRCVAHVADCTYAYKHRSAAWPLASCDRTSRVTGMLHNTLANSCSLYLKHVKCERNNFKIPLTTGASFVLAQARVCFHRCDAF